MDRRPEFPASEDESLALRRADARDERRILLGGQHLLRLELHFPKPALPLRLHGRQPAHAARSSAGPTIARARSRSTASRGTSSRRPIFIVGISPLFAASYAEFRPRPSCAPASGTVMVLLSTAD